MSYQDEQPALRLTGDGTDGFPSEEEFVTQMEDYLQGLNPKKRAKALSTYSLQHAALQKPRADSSHSTSQ